MSVLARLFSDVTGHPVTYLFSAGIARSKEQRKEFSISWIFSNVFKILFLHRQIILTTKPPIELHQTVIERSWFSAAVLVQPKPPKYIVTTTVAIWRVSSDSIALITADMVKFLRKGRKQTRLGEHVIYNEVKRIFHSVPGDQISIFIAQCI